MKKLIVYLLEIIICFVLQSSMFHYIQLADIMPNLLLILVAATAYMRGRMTGMMMGLFSGLLVDLMYGSYVIGLYALLYLIIGYFIGFTNKVYSRDDYTLPIIIIAISDFIYGFFYYVFEFLLRGRLNFLYYLRRFILPEIIYTVAISVFMYKLLHMINHRLYRKPDEEV
ncbi:rod shape-determining protein MreD [Lachnospiraceae bacterium MD1]|uniref:Rod shape-determining protein MreD n=1 Tax=Variimorphobacter saccharofermentans TaxID=2755051 RepID=A0A839JZZ6_9FIRM|nr:rod shape-determining protein MreD [Variimorphobacter saccharofermentans]MBB2182984.1 rod shape-determining protein MreD [Variimorphobacter saccharofermentans]